LFAWKTSFALGVVHEEHTIPGPNQNELTVTIFRKKDCNTSSQLFPAIYHIYGRGMIMGNRFCNLSGMLESVLEFDIICVAVEYRLAPAHPDPAIIEDCYAGLQWTFANAPFL
jgi:acetyl esterase/lipase